MAGLNQKNKNLYAKSANQKKSGMKYIPLTINVNNIPKNNNDIIFIGLDISIKNTGICIKEPNKDYIVDNIPTEKLPVDNRYKKFIFIWSVLEEMISKLDKTKTILFCIESYAMFGTSVVQLAELGGFLRTMLISKNYQIHDISPNSVKLYATGNGNSDKSLVIQNMSRKLNINFKSDDEADAAAMCCFLQENIDKIRNGNL